MLFILLNSQNYLLTKLIKVATQMSIDTLFKEHCIRFKRTLDCRVDRIRFKLNFKFRAEVLALDAIVLVKSNEFFEPTASKDW